MSRILLIKVLKVDVTLALRSFIARESLAKVSCTRVVVKRTFIDVEVDDVSDDDQDRRWEIPLTPPLDPGTDNAEFDEWRRAYRRFRLGY